MVAVALVPASWGRTRRAMSGRIVVDKRETCFRRAKALPPSESGALK
jgi:hypothetical protein